ncbi:MAG: baseplate J/gp47 family protein [Planctomycetota bacterium]
MQTELGVGPTPRRSMVQALAAAMAGAVAGAHGHVGWAIRQIFPDTAEGENLERWASIWGMTRKPATFAAGLGIAKGTAGKVLDEGTLLQIGGQTYVVTATSVVQPASPGVPAAVTFPIEALEPGEAGNQAAETILTFNTPVQGIVAHGFVKPGTDGVIGGNDPESDESLRGRLLERLKSPPRGGAVADYEAWAREVPGVTRAWAFANHLGIGTVGLTFLREDDSDSSIPSQGELDEVEQYIARRAPIGAELVVFAPAILQVDFSLSVQPNTAAVKAAVEASLADLFTLRAEPGVDIPISHLHEAISTTPGEKDHVLVAPAANIEVPAGTIARLGVVTWL